MQTVDVALGDRSYPIHVGAGLLAKPDLLEPHIRGKRVAVVTNETIAPIYLDQLGWLKERFELSTIILPDGEQFKTLETLQQVFDRLLHDVHGRDTTLIALGGGVIGDMTGFAAACFMRGVSFIQIPTTLLAQVDSSVGGKTGVNHPLGKNMIGAFHQPVCVLADVETLTTLPDRQLAAGLAEVVKYGLIRDPGFFAWIEHNVDCLTGRDPGALSEAVRRSCENKAEIVIADEKEAGVRALLNFGHTFGHAIETALHYEGWLHGEAVAAGMMMAADLSARMGWLEHAEVERMRTVLEQLQLPTEPPPGIGSDRFESLMARDKKVLAGKLRLVLLRELGHAVICDDFPQTDLRATLGAYAG